MKTFNELFTELDELTTRVEGIGALNYFARLGVQEELKNNSVDKQLERELDLAHYQLELISRALTKDLNKYVEDYRATLTEREGAKA